MKLSVANVCLITWVTSVTLIIAGNYYKYAEAKRLKENPPPDESIMTPEFDPLPPIMLIEGAEINNIKLRNKAYYWLSDCLARDLPRGLRVKVSVDRATCEIFGVPEEAGPLKEGAIIAVSKTRARTLVKLSITIMPPSGERQGIDSASP